MEPDGARCLNDLSTILWRERQLLELLLFKLEEEQLLLATGRVRWLAQAAREVESVLDAIRMAEVGRAAEVDAVAAELGLAPGASLNELVAAAPAPWSAILADHRRAFVGVTEEIMGVAQSNRELLTKGQSAVRDALRWVEGAAVDDYGLGGLRSRRSRALLVDEAL